MDFNFSRNTKTIKEIYDAFQDTTLIVDDSYQRRRVWLTQDKVRLIETVLLNLIIPEIFLWDCNIDPDTGKTVRHIVDGQQRISAIVDFISDEFKLSRKNLLNDDAKNKYGDLSFSELPPEIKKRIWGYNLSIVNIDRRCTIDDITDLFYRLNLTNYSLNEQEKRNSLSSEFGNASEILADNEFWNIRKVFSPADIRRMKDVEFCSNILILAREGIVDQASQQKLNQVYDELKEKYEDKEGDIHRVTMAMELVNLFANDTTVGFLSKKVQIYSLFSLVLYLIDIKVSVDNNMVKKFTAFVETYSKFKNEKEIEFNDNEESIIYEAIKRYKLASSEGINKYGNRMIRYEILKKICFNDDDHIVINLEKVQRVICKE